MDKWERQYFLYKGGYSREGLVQLSTTGANVGEVFRGKGRKLPGHLKFNKIIEVGLNEGEYED